MKEESQYCMNHQVFHPWVVHKLSLHTYIYPLLPIVMLPSRSVQLLLWDFFIRIYEWNEMKHVSIILKQIYYEQYQRYSET
jgi:hypothetical protein